jgi:hypothetical protein
LLRASKDARVCRMNGAGHDGRQAAEGDGVVMRRSSAPLNVGPILVALAVSCTWTACVSGAAMTYQTEGQTLPWIYGTGETPGYTGTNVIRFQPASLAAITPGVPFSLGNFVLSPLPDGSSTVYHHEAFLITLELNPPGQTPEHAPFSSLTLYGALDGTLAGSGRSNVVAQVLSIQPTSGVRIEGSPGASQTPPAFPVPFPLSALKIDPITLAPASAGGTTALMAEIDPTVLPEPASAGIALALIGAWGVVRRRLVAKS